MVKGQQTLHPPSKGPKVELDGVNRRIQNSGWTEENFIYLSLATTGKLKVKVNGKPFLLLGGYFSLQATPPSLLAYPNINDFNEKYACIERLGKDSEVFLTWQNTHIT